MSDLPRADDRIGDRTEDPWAPLRTKTTARIGLGRSGDAMQTRDVLAFQLAHARARDAVHTPLDVAALAAHLPAPPLHVHSQAPDRTTYLRRPDLGRRLDPACGPALPAQPCDAVFVIADGLSATGVQAHAAPLLAACVGRLQGWTLGPTIVATQARVALGDEIGARVGAGMVVVLIGERPGLSAADSVGIYLTFGPHPGIRDSARNCISNVHPAGLGYPQAADKLVWLMREARRRKLTGVALKDDGMALVGEEIPADRLA